MDFYLYLQWDQTQKTQEDLVDQINPKMITM